MNLAIMFLLITIVFGMLTWDSIDSIKREKYTVWHDGKVTIAWGADSPGCIEYYAEGVINGKRMRGTSIIYTSSNIIYSRGQEVSVKYKELNENEFLFKIDNPNLVSIDEELKPWGIVRGVITILSAIMMVVAFIYRW